MAITVIPYDTPGESHDLGLQVLPFTEDLFSANFLYHRDLLGAAGTYDDSVEALNINHIRYPGGTIAETNFDISNPNNPESTNGITGEVSPVTPLNEFLEWAHDTDRLVTMVLPTRTYLSTETDANGDRFADIDEAELRGFLRGLLDGDFGPPVLEGIEIGNEYWGRAGMNAIEYGRIASEMVKIVEDEIQATAGAPNLTDQIDIIVQMGTNYGNSNLAKEFGTLPDGSAQLRAMEEKYDVTLEDKTYLYPNGSVAYARVNNALLLKSFDETAEIEPVDAVAAHIYSAGPERPISREFDLNIIRDSGWDEKFADEGEQLDRYVTEWNYSSFASNIDNTSERGLSSAREILEIFENFAYHNVEEAYFWPVQQNTDTDLANKEGDGSLTVSGEMFRLMSERLVGLTPLQTQENPADDQEVDDPETGGAVHTYVGEGKLVAFIFAGETPQETTEVDLSAVIEDYGAAEFKLLGVNPGELPCSCDSTPRLLDLDPEQVVRDGSILSVSLLPFEIIAAEFSNVTFVAPFQLPPPPPEDPIIPVIPEDEVPEEEDPEDPETPEDGEDGSDGTCFVATAAYRSATHPDVRALRAFRDSVLTRSSAGRMFIAWYWIYGPKLAGPVRRSTLLSACSRGLIKLLLGPIRALTRAAQTREAASKQR